MAKKKEAETSATPATAAIAEPKPESKVDAVRAAIKAGVLKPTAASAHIKKQYGLDVPPAMFSAYKSQMKHKNGFKPARSPKATSVISRNGIENIVGSVQTIKKLVDELGVEQVKQIAEIFA